MPVRLSLNTYSLTTANRAIVKTKYAANLIKPRSSYRFGSVNGLRLLLHFETWRLRMFAVRWRTRLISRLSYRSSTR